MNGTPAGVSDDDEAVGSGIDKGRCGFTVADVGRGGRESTSGVRPGIKSATTFCTDRGFCKHVRLMEHHKGRRKHTSTLTQLGGGASADKCRTKSRMSC